MKLQRLNWTCGVAALVNAFKCYGKRISEKTVYKQALTNKDGSTEEGVVASIVLNGFSYNRSEESSFKASFEWLDAQLLEGNPVILCVNNWNHWVVAIGRLGDRVVIFDSDNTPKNRKENGVLVLSKKQLKRLWLHVNDNKYFGLAVIKK